MSYNSTDTSEIPQPFSTTTTTTTSTIPTTTTTQRQPPPTPSTGYKFPYPLLVILLVWLLIGLAYVVAKWRQKSRAQYVVPRVFVLCSPRTAQFHYELILRIGLASYEFNPEKHDIDITVQGAQKNEVVPMTRLNTRTLQDEPLITTLSIIVYRLVELPPLGSLVLRHSGPYKAWLYVYDFTVIDLSSNKEQYYPMNQYIGSLSKTLELGDPNVPSPVTYPVDDVPLPQWSTEDIFLVLYAAVNCIMLSVSLSPINCDYLLDIVSVAVSTLHGGSVVIFLDWLLYYNMRWDQERREYFNLAAPRFCCSENIIRSILAFVSTGIGLCAIYYSFDLTEWMESLVWLLTTVDTLTLVIGFWNVARQAELGQSVVALGLRMRGTEMISVGMKYSELITDVHTKSNSTSDDGGSTLSNASKLARSIGPRSSVKSFGFDAITGHQPNRAVASKMIDSHLSSVTGATPNNQTGTLSLRNRPNIKPPHHRSSLKSSINLHIHQLPHQQATVTPSTSQTQQQQQLIDTRTSGVGHGLSKKDAAERSPRRATLRLPSSGSTKESSSGRKER